ncbi:MAG: hypothetical protein V4858_19860 [Pseudomonadota bacterium]
MKRRKTNRDPITGSPGAHPVGTGIGAAVGGAAVGAAAGTTAGPVGTAIGAAAGAVVGGLAGKSVAEAMEPTDESAETAYWRDNFVYRPYVGSGASFDDFGPAYDFGARAFGSYSGRSFEEAEADLGRDWDSARGTSSLTWARAREAARDAWERLRQSRHVNGGA